MTNVLLNEDIIGEVSAVFEQLKEPVEVLFFGKKMDCEYCADTLQLIQEVVDLSKKLSLTIVDIEEEPAVAGQYNVDKTPGLVVAGRDGEKILDYGIRHAGIPSGHEFSTLINDIVMVSGRESGLNQQTREFLNGLNEPVLMQVFVTPTCPYCPRAVILAHQMALESPMVEAEMVEATEFPELANRFNVSGVPQTTINNGAGTVVGAVPEENMLAELMRVTG